MTTSPSQLGFLTVLRDPTGYLGGYLVTNLWGRPLEFRLSSAVQPNRVQQILYGQSLEPYLCGDLIGKTLIDKIATPAHAILTDTPAALELRRRLELPVGLVQHPGRLTQDGRVPSDRAGDGQVTTHHHFPGDAAAFRELMSRLGAFDLAEPFSRVREAIAEARKLGVAARS